MAIIIPFSPRPRPAAPPEPAPVSAHPRIPPELAPMFLALLDDLADGAPLTPTELRPFAGPDSAGAPLALYTLGRRVQFLIYPAPDSAGAGPDGPGPVSIRCDGVELARVSLAELTAAVTAYQRLLATRLAR